MSDSFTALEVIEIAIEMEKNGEKFYLLAAEKCGDEGIKNFLLKLARMENHHAIDFEKIKADVKSAQDNCSVYDPNEEIAGYLKNIAKSAGFEGRVAPGVGFTGDETLKEILQKALVAENNSVEYYTGINKLVSTPEVKEKIENIIKEEMDHATELQKELDNIV